MNRENEIARTRGNGMKSTNRIAKRYKSLPGNK
jgi:hypothetical protein